MDESEAFREHLLRIMRERGLSARAVSKAAGLNERAVKDIEEGRSKSPKLSTIFKIAVALEQDPGEMLGLGKRPKVRADLAEFLSRYSEADQERFLSALALLAGQPREER